MAAAAYAAVCESAPATPYSAPLFVRDRYGSHDSRTSLSDVEPKPIEDNGPVDSNPWASETTEPQPYSTPKTTQQQLPPADRGTRAWAVLAAAAIMEGLIWGFPLSYGIFQQYYANQDHRFKGDGRLPIIGVMGTGMFYLGAPCMTFLAQRFPCQRREFIWLGWPISISSLVAASFAPSVPALILTQGFMYSVGAMLLFMPILSILGEWFEARRGFAYAIQIGATGVTGAFLPFLSSALLERFGTVTTLRLFAIILGVPTLPCLLILRSRLPRSMLPAPAHALGAYRLLLRSPLFYIYSVSNMAASLAFFMPLLFLPSIATSLGLSALDGATFLAVTAVAQCLGQLLFGYLSDHSTANPQHRSVATRFVIPFDVLVIASPLFSFVAAVALWGPASNLALLVLFAVIWGISASGNVTLWTRMGTLLAMQIVPASSSAADLPDTVPSSPVSPSEMQLPETWDDNSTMHGQETWHESRTWNEKGAALNGADTWDEKPVSNIGAGASDSWNVHPEDASSWSEQHPSQLSNSVETVGPSVRTHADSTEADGPAMAQAGAISSPDSNRDAGTDTDNVSDNVAGAGAEAGSGAADTIPLAAFSLLSFQKGIGSLVAGPLSSLLVQGEVQVGTFGAGRYMPLVTFTAGCMLVSALVVLVAGLWRAVAR